jgi:hypothetical protein
MLIATVHLRDLWCGHGVSGYSTDIALAGVVFQVSYAPYVVTYHRLESCDLYIPTDEEIMSLADMISVEVDHARPPGTRVSIHFADPTSSVFDSAREKLLSHAVRLACLFSRES